MFGMIVGRAIPVVVVGAEVILPGADVSAKIPSKRAFKSSQNLRPEIMHREGVAGIVNIEFRCACGQVLPLPTSRSVVTWYQGNRRFPVLVRSGHQMPRVLSNPVADSVIAIVG